jgi:hypothetical protein
MQDGTFARALAAFVAADDDVELSLKAEDMVRVLEAEAPDTNGWILVERVSDGKSGFVPSSYLAPCPANELASRAKDAFSMRNVNAALPSSHAPTPTPGSPRQPLMNQPTSNNPFDRLDDNKESNLSPQASLSGEPPQQQTMAPPPPPARLPPASALATDYPPAWLARDAHFQFALPHPPVRRWYYRDASNAVKGPHDPHEMLSLFSSGAIPSVVGLEVGSGEVSCIEERPLQLVYPNTAMAFQQAPVLPGCWYYLENNNQFGTTEEHGPFSCAQMKLWLEKGCFARYSQIRPADGLRPYAELSSFFPQPALAFAESAQGWASQPQVQFAFVVMFLDFCCCFRFRFQFEALRIGISIIVHTPRTY